ncbi:MAG: hypothetical protein QNJ68_07940 [Microcoleaceae cyanobacterium MO_207.B10]|nr:hypothetical protein [Microcoleaceae cyanobacterium MO_207.B10]
MTLAIERPLSQAVDGLLKADIKFLVSNLDQATYDIAYHFDAGIEYILIDTKKHHYQIKISQEKITLLKYPYLHDGSLGAETEQEIVLLPQFVALLEG